jgi:3-oxoacyl-[acyl-carrier protein] reductase
VVADRRGQPPRAHAVRQSRVTVDDPAAVGNDHQCGELPRSSREHGLLGGGSYPTSKAALVRFTDTLAASTDEYDVRVFTISPGLVLTALTEAIDEFRSIPESEWSPPEAAASLVVRLAVSEGTALNGRFIHVHDDLDEMLREDARIKAEGLSTLRLNNLSGPVP